MEHQQNHGLMQAEAIVRTVLGRASPRQASIQKKCTAPRSERMEPSLTRVYQLRTRHVQGGL